MATLRLLADFEIMPRALDLLRWLVPACKTANGRFNEWDVLNGGLTRDYQIWIAEDGREVIAVGVTRITEYPRARSCKVHIGTGKNRKAWQGFMLDLMAWAKTQGCTLFEAHTRSGWARVFKGTLHQSHVFLEARI
jgi:hypothetical protein